MTREEAIHFAECLKHNWTIDFNDMEDFCGMAIEALSEPRGDIISRADAIRWVKTECNPYGKPTLDYDSGLKVIEHLEKMPSAEVETVECTEFIRWLTETVMDDGMWELNAVAYGEVIARKLTKLGVLEVKDDVYVYEPSADAVEVVRCKDCKCFELDHFDRIDGIPLITAHEICTKWSGGCKTSKDGFCFMGERKNNDDD